MKWQNKITRDADESPEQLLANPFNWRIHSYEQQDLMKRALDTVGWIQKIIVNENTGHVIDGHMRVAIAISEGQKTVPVTYVSLTDNEEKTALALFDSIGQLAITDPGSYKTLYDEIEFADDSLAEFIAQQTADIDYLSFSADDAKGLDELPVSATYTTTYSVQIAFQTEDEKRAFVKALQTKCQERGFDYGGDLVRDWIENG